MPFEPDHGGQGLPWLVAVALQEMWATGNMGFSLCPLLTQGGVEVLTKFGTPEQQKLYLEKLVSGEWTGTMNLTEPQAGSDVGAIRMKAVKDGADYRLYGQKIYITYGEHDYTPNIIHMVLARTEGAPEGSKGLSLFIVPKVLVNADGSLGARNDVKAVSLEHKLGIHASPTAVLAFGDSTGAVAHLIGEEGRGIEYMFVMMNAARLGVGMQGVAMCERAYQHARGYARDRVQSRDVANPKGEAVAIIQHPDVQRMLLTMRAYAEATRALAYSAMASLDLASKHEDETVRRVSQLRVDLLTPVVKAWSTDLGVEAASLGIQVHGGMGYIEETGAAQHYRDAKIACIYEGTNGIQANDLVFRKIGRDNGAMALGFVAEGRAAVAGLAALPGDDAAAIAARLGEGLTALEGATIWVAANHKTDPKGVAAAAASYLRLFGFVAGGVMLAKSAGVALAELGQPGSEADFLTAKLVVARFYMEQLLPPTTALASTLESAGRTTGGFVESWF